MVRVTMYASVRLVSMNTAARIAVARDKRSGGAARTEHRAGRASAKTRASIGTLATLHQHQHDDAHRAEQLDDRQ